ncbi:alpha/beta hydrolase family protein [Flavobacterium hungaricum]|uniref:alpha/beta hydrolase family protein n=1 Tax=Flavobacterium hungaricum TaxID=2082725 RepID=UPI001D152D4C|nr:prolyl oligopeptidase family serine peptidase [Flavobacterium hungaricum]
MLLVTCPLRGQDLQKKKLLPEDYHFWGQTVLEKVSPDENWASFKMSYENESDTLLVQNVFNNKTFRFADGKQGTFLGNSFICIINDRLHILDLKTLIEKTFEGVESFSCSNAEQMVLLLYSTGTNKDALEIYSLKTRKSILISKVTNFLLSPEGSSLFYTVCDNNKNSAAYVDLKKMDNMAWLIKDSEEKITSAVWQRKGQGVAFIEQFKDERHNRLFYYRKNENRTFKLSSESDSIFFKSWCITPEISRQIIISDDLQKVFFAVKNNCQSFPLTAKNKVEIWNTQDKLIYTDQIKQGALLDKTRCAMWLPDQSKLKAVTSQSLPSIILDADMNYAYLSNPKQYEPQFEYEGCRDFYAVDLKTFEKKIFLKNHPYDYYALNPSPGGKYFAYFKESNWWIYNPKEDTHTNITATLKVNFKGKKYELIPESVYGNPGWTDGDKKILIYDQFDIWSINPDGKSARRLTKGREKQIVYRIIIPDSRHLKKIYDGPVLQTFDLDKPLFLRAKGPNENIGCFIWKKSAGEKQLHFSESYLDQFKLTDNKQHIFYREQNFDVPPQLVSLNNVTGKSITFFKSNAQHKKYFWGKSELISFENSKGDSLKAVLIYPAAYNPDKKYPMVVNIYEKKSSELHMYQNPSLLNGGGFNALVYSLEGYFVLLPDIKLEYQNPGISAFDCVASAVRKVLTKDLVNFQKIGLLGHSFGGYESLFITTQTSMFASVVASGAITDLVSYYHSVGSFGRPNIWRFEAEQWNMGSPHEIPELYKANSAIFHADKIDKPLLLWSGKNDPQVDMRQSQEFYLALRRLRKKSIMLLYPDEGHILLDKKNQKDITIRTLQWFNYFLKDDHTSDWISFGVN